MPSLERNNSPLIGSLTVFRLRGNHASTGRGADAAGSPNGTGPPGSRAKNLQVNGQPMDLNREQMRPTPPCRKTHASGSSISWKIQSKRRAQPQALWKLHSLCIRKDSAGAADAAGGRCNRLRSRRPRNWGFCIGIFPSSRIQKYLRPFPSSNHLPANQRRAGCQRDTEAVIAASWTSAVPSERGWKPAAAFPGSAIRKKTKSPKKNLVLLCDVSGSMMQFSEFALRFIQALNQVSESSLVFLFSEEMCHADAFSLQNMNLFRNYVKKESGIYGRGTDLGAALQKAVRHESCCFAGIHNLADSL